MFQNEIWWTQCVTSWLVHSSSLSIIIISTTSISSQWLGKVGSLLHSRLQNVLLEASLLYTVSLIQICMYILGVYGKYWATLELVDAFHCNYLGKLQYWLHKEVVADAVEESNQFNNFVFSLIEHSSIQIATAWVVLSFDYSPVGVEFLHMPYPQDNHGIWFLFVCLPFPPCMWICSPGNLWLGWGYYNGEVVY